LCGQDAFVSVWVFPFCSKIYHGIGFAQNVKSLNYSDLLSLTHLQFVSNFYLTDQTDDIVTMNAD
jgi:hypothetical protein